MNKVITHLVTNELNGWKTHSKRIQDGFKTHSRRFQRLGLLLISYGKISAIYKEEKKLKITRVFHSLFQFEKDNTVWGKSINDDQGITAPVNFIKNVYPVYFSYATSGLCGSGWFILLKVFLVNEYWDEVR